MKIFLPILTIAGLVSLAGWAASAPASPFEIWPPEKTGITFRHDNALSERRYQPESVGPGVAIFDYNNDGRMDLYFPNSGPADFYQPVGPRRSALFRNNGNGTFTDVTLQAGVANAGNFGLGAAAADYDGDGFVDLLVTNYGHNVLYRNKGNGTFEDATLGAGLDQKGFYTSAVWFDYNNDGKLDLFVGHFVQFSKDQERDCRTAGVHHYCYPASYDANPSKLYRNNGDGTFADVSVASGIAEHPGKTFSAVAADLDGDGFMDLFVSNDSVPNFLFHNKGDGTFEERGLEAGVAYSDDGLARSGMGVDAADYDQDGRIDLFVANLNRERFSLYSNEGHLTFSDKAASSGVGRATYLLSGWGLKFFDFDNDGALDLVMTNGHPDDRIEAAHTGLQWKEPVLLLRNAGGAFVAQPLPAGLLSGRGLAIGDLDNDGWPDVVIAQNGDAPVVLHNRAGRNHWIGLAGLPSGAIVRWPGGTRAMVAGGSYLSSHDPRMLIGLGEKTRLEWLEIDWPAPDKHAQTIRQPKIDSYLNVRAR